jgi:hypothetical protein
MITNDEHVQSVQGATNLLAVLPLGIIQSVSDPD